MAAKRTPGSRPGLIYCEHCGEEYSSSYRRCPFCDEYDEYEDVPESTSDRSTPRSGGKRLAQSNRRGGGYRKISPFRVIGYIISLIVIIAAIWVVINVIRPLILLGDVDNTPLDSNSSLSGEPATSPSVSPDSEPNIEPSPAVSPDVSEPPAAITTPEAEPSPDSSASIAGTANGFTLHKSEFSFTPDYPDPVTLKVNFSPAGTTGTITWTSSNTNYATVDENGKVSPGPQKGTAIITATLANGVSQTCKVHNQVIGSSSAPSQSTDTGTYSINKSDFTFYRSGETTKLKAVGYSGNVTWTSSNTSVATVSSDGTCKAVGNGRCTITGTLENGTTISAIARVNIP